MEKNLYRLKEEDSIISPALIYYIDYLNNNTDKAIEIAGGPHRLWPHVKSHKMKEVVYLQLNKGIKRFKCATVAEAEMVASCNAPHVLIAYPLIGPNINRFIELKKRYTKTTFWAIGDDLHQIELLNDALKKSNLTTNLLIDVNLEMNRTGVPFYNLETLTNGVIEHKAIKLKGYHCYDGHLGITNIDERQKRVEKELDEMKDILDNIDYFKDFDPIFIMGGTPTFPCHARHENVYLSPGTIFINDDGYSNKLPDLNFPPAAAILTRVVSRPDKNIFTLDLGTKGIASDPVDTRGRIIGYPNAIPIIHSEEHWVFEMDESEIPEIGTIVYVIPTHICPTSALYPNVLVAENGNLVNTWTVDARNRKINI